MTDPASAIQTGKTALGIEFGSTRVKAVLIADDFSPLAEGIFDWENRFEHGVWTYRESDILAALRCCFSALRDQVQHTFGVPLKTVGCIGVSGMMHGYVALDKDGRLLVPFRTWRNTNTRESAARLTAALDFHIPERWTAAHLYHAVRTGEPHVKDLAHLTTLAGYVHLLLTGEKAVGVGEASGIFPIDSAAMDYDAGRLSTFDRLLGDAGMPLHAKDLFPKVLPAGADAGALTETGAALLDDSGTLQPGIPFCPPEGDAGTGMVATNSVRPRTGNISAGTSVFAMLVLERALSKAYPEIDLVTTPAGDPVAMVHCNNCTADIDAWARVFLDFAERGGASLTRGQCFDLLYETALQGDADCGGLLSFNYLSGEAITNIQNGVPLFLRSRDSALTFPNFARNLLFSAVCTLRLGMDILTAEGVEADVLLGHGGFFKSGAGQRVMAAALKQPVTVMRTANVGGPWGMAILAAYCLWNDRKLSLADFLSQAVFAGCESVTAAPDAADTAGFDAYLSAYKNALPLEQTADRLLFS
ncbi:MAG: ATPase [Clostridia bacterium]|nr:ATPase [Clostridia bacterium]